MAFGHVQGGAANVGNLTAGTPATLTNIYPSTPTQGNLLVVSVVGAIAGTPFTLSVKDSNNNNYSTNSNFHYAGAGGGVGFWWLVAPANASRSVVLTANSNNLNFTVAWAEEFSLGGSSVSYDTEVYDVTQAGNSTAINTPTITPTTGDLLVGVCNPANTITHPTNGEVVSGWTGAAGGITSGDMAEYLLSAAASNTAAYTQNSAGTWVTGIAAFKLTAGGPVGDFTLEASSGHILLETSGQLAQEGHG